MSRICRLVNTGAMVKKAGMPLPPMYRPDVSRYSSDNPLESIANTMAYMLGPASALPSFLAAPAEIVQTILIDKLFNKLKEKKINRRSYAEGYSIGLNNPFLRMAPAGEERNA